MMEQKKKRLTELQEDWGKLRKAVGLVWRERRMFGKFVGAALVLGLVYVFSIPKTYSTSVILAPESPGSGLSASMSSLASIAGMNLSGVSEDALAVELYPTIVASKDFLVPLFDVPVHLHEQQVDTTYAGYLMFYQKSAWWSYPGKLVGLGLKMLFSPKDSDKSVFGEASSVKVLSEKEYGICQAMQGVISCSVDKISGVLTVTVFDQNAEISAMMADTVVARLNKFIQDYRTRKARSDYDYVKDLCDKAKKDYLDAQGRYADFTGKHTDLYAPQVKAQLEYLQNESELAFAAYSQVRTQLQTAHAKVLESTPVYTIVESAYVPERAAAPKKVLTMLVFVFLACMAAMCKLFYKYCLKSDV